MQCPLCAPRPETGPEWDFVAKLEVSSLYLAANQTYRGQCVLIFDPRHVPRPDQLSAGEFAALSRDLHRSAQAVVSTARADHLNVESLGNAVPHVHWHVIPRLAGDARWGAPVWTSELANMKDTRLEASERAELVVRLREALARGA